MTPPSFHPVRQVVLAILLLTVLQVSCSDDESTPTGPGPDPHEGWVAWSHPDGSTHWYRAVPTSAGITWEAANDSAIAAGGYLVTITSAEENVLVFGLIDGGAYWLERPSGDLAGPWIGAVQPPGSVEPIGNWQWITGEAFGYANWSATQPDEKNFDNQNRIHFGEADAARRSTWDDLNGGQILHGYVIETSDSTAPRMVGLVFHEEGSYIGYTLFAPLLYRTTYLIDNDGRLVHSWAGQYQPGNSVYLLEDGHLLRTATLNPMGTAPFMSGGAGGRVEKVAWDGTIVWEFEYQSDQHLLHHDVENLPNGNILMIAWEYKAPGDAIAAGRKPSSLTQQGLWPDHVIEVEPTGSTGGNIIWEWHIWDHLIQDYDPTEANYGVVADHPELIDINFDPAGLGAADWNHTNGIDYNERLDQILLSVRMFSEIWVIDHSTTAAEAAGHSGGRCGKGGDLIYRWGNPQAYRAGGSENQTLFVQHNAEWIGTELSGEGNILVFNNGQGRPDGDYSSLDEIAPPVQADGTYSLARGTAYGPAAAEWRYVANPPHDFYSSYISGVQRLANGNTLACEGSHGTFSEVTPEGTVVWRYVNPVVENGPLTQGEPIPETLLGTANAVFRCTRYRPDYPGLAGRDLTPGDPVEVYPTKR